ncbi:FtsX-like permease family protein [Streptomyces smyrnaeus]|uniref:FtsX-like permease family protein n=1 Tax=Streptomyces smyrnaeus TaxID=1387713 RepID=UPI0033B51EA7
MVTPTDPWHRRRSGIRLLTRRAARHHRSAWSTTFAALVLTSLLLGVAASAVASVALGHPRVTARAAAPVVVAGSQTTEFTAKPWGSEPETVRAALTERVRVPRAALAVLREVEGVRAAVPDDAFTLRTGAGDKPLPGRSWQAASLAPYPLREGRAPRSPGEVVAGAGLHAEPGQRLAGRRVVGVAEGPAVLYTTAAEARRLAGHPRSVDAIGVLAAPGTSTDQLSARVRDALDQAHLRDAGAGARAAGDPAALRVLTGDSRGAAENLRAAPARSALLELLGSVTATLVLVALLVICSLSAQALHQREPELRLLRTVGATPAQLRAMIGREVSRTAARAALWGASGAVPGFLALHSALAARGARTEGLELPTPAWAFLLPLGTAALTVGVARLAAVLACARVARDRPAQTVTGPGGKGRRVTGLVLLLAGASSAGTAALQRGEAAAAAASAAAVTLVIGCALLSPWIAAAAVRLLRRPLHRLGGVGGRLAETYGRADSRRLGAALTPVVLVTAFAGVQLSATATVDEQTGHQASRALRAELAVTAPGGLPTAVLDRLRATDGVAAATGLARSTVVLARKETGEPRLERLPALGVTPRDLPETLDPGVREGTLAGLRPGSVSVGADRARSQDLHPGSTVRIRFGDGAERTLRVAAVHERSLALGDFLLSRGELTRHTTDTRLTRVLVATADDAVPERVRAAVQRTVDAVAPGARVGAARPLEPPRAEGEAAVRLVSGMAVAAIAVLAALTVISTLRLVRAGRRSELALLRVLGMVRGQLCRMLAAEATVLVLAGSALGAAVAALPLTALSFALARSLPSLPLWQAVAVVASVVVTTAAGTLWPVRRDRNRDRDRNCGRGAGWRAGGPAPAAARAGACAAQRLR